MTKYRGHRKHRIESLIDETEVVLSKSDEPLGAKKLAEQTNATRREMKETIKQMLKRQIVIGTLEFKYKLRS